MPRAQILTEVSRRHPCGQPGPPDRSFPARYKGRTGQYPRSNPRAACGRSTAARHPHFHREGKPLNISPTPQCRPVPWFHGRPSRAPAWAGRPPYNGPTAPVRRAGTTKQNCNRRLCPNIRASKWPRLKRSGDRQTLRSCPGELKHLRRPHRAGGRKALQEPSESAESPANRWGVPLSVEDAGCTTGRLPLPRRPGLPTDSRPPDTAGGSSLPPLHHRPWPGANNPPAIRPDLQRNACPGPWGVPCFSKRQGAAQGRRTR